MNKIFSLLFVLLICQSTNFAQTAQHTGHRSWSPQSNIYEVNLRQYTAAGTFNAFAKELPRLKKMGVEILWFMPITPIGIEGRKMSAADLGSYYSVRDYKNTNPEFGSLKDFTALVQKAHQLGFKVITDWVANHSAIDNRWVSTHPNFYTKGSDGKYISPFDWTDVYKLNYADRELRDSMMDAMKFWLTQTKIDGFRCDVAEEVPEDFWKECIGNLRKIKDVFMLAEGNKPSLHEVGFDATYTWNTMSSMADLYAKKISLHQFDSSLNASMKAYPSNAYRMYFTTNHDENSWAGTEFEKYGKAYKALSVFTMTYYQSIPLVYSGQEAANKTRLKFFVKDPIQWGTYELADFYGRLLRLRRSNPALAADASYRKLTTTKDDAIFSYVREKNGHKVLVVLNLSDQPQTFHIKDKSIKGNPYNVFLFTKEAVGSSNQLNIEPWGFIVYDYK